MDGIRAQTTLVCGVIAFAIAVAALLQKRGARSLLFAAFSGCISAWYLSQSLSLIVGAAVFDRVTMVLTVLLPQSAINLFRRLAVPKGTRLAPSRLGAAAFVLGIPAFVLAALTSRAYASPAALAYLYTYVVGMLTLALVDLYLRSRQSESRSVRDRMRFLSVVGAASFLFTLADFLSVLGGPLKSLPPVGAVLSVIFLFVMAESLRRPRLGDLYELSSKLVTYTLLAFALSAIFYGFVEYLGRIGAMYLNAVLVALVFLVLFEPLREQIERRVQRYLFRERDQLASSVRALRKELSRAVEPGAAMLAVTEGLVASRRVTCAAVYLRDAEGYARMAASGEESVPRLDGGVARPLIERLATRAVVLEDFAREGQDARRDLAISALQPQPSCVLLALHEGDSVVGFLLVGERRMSDAFPPDEVALLESVTADLALKLVNSRDYERLKERDRLASLGAMAAGLAHEIKNPLGSIRGAAELLDDTAPDEASREFVGVILEETQRLNRVVTQFLDYARPRSGDPSAFDLNAAVERTVKIVMQEGHPGIELRLDLAPDLPELRLDVEHLRQALMNILRNAIQAVEGHGVVQISTCYRADPIFAGRGTVSDIWPRVELSVADSGPGLSEAARRGLFVPFFTTKSKGTGLGLAISQNLMQAAGGRIDVRRGGVVGTASGATFVIVLPIVVAVSITPTSS